MQSTGILQYCTLLEVQFLMGVMVDLVVVGLHDVGVLVGKCKCFAGSTGQP